MSQSKSVEFQARPDLHQRYRIEAVPLLVIADGRGVVRGHFLGPVTATDLWAAVATARAAEPNSARVAESFRVTGAVWRGRGALVLGMGDVQLDR